MDRFLRMVALVVVVPATSLIGQWCDGCGDYGLQAEALYWLGNNLATNVGTRSESQEVAGDPPLIIERTGPDLRGTASLDWGVRVGGSWRNGCTSLNLSYLWWEGTSSNRYAGPTVFPSSWTFQTFAGQPSDLVLTQAMRTRYQNVDLRVAHNLFSGCRHAFHLAGVFRYLDLADYTSRGLTGVQLQALDPFTGQIVSIDEPFTGSLSDTVTYRAGGVGVGFGGHYAIGCGIGVEGHLDVLGFVGRQKRNLWRTTDTRIVVAGDPPAEFLVPPVTQGNMAFFDPQRTCTVPAIDLRLGLSYSFSCGCTHVSLLLGYEYHYYAEALYYNIALLPDGQGVFPIRDDEYHDVGFGGPTFGLAVEF